MSEAFSRRSLFARLAAGSAALLAPALARAERRRPGRPSVAGGGAPAILKHGLNAPCLAGSANAHGACNERALALLEEGADTLDAVVAGVNTVEDDPNKGGVGLGGYPNEHGVMQLDASVMHGPTHEAGAVAPAWCRPSITPRPPSSGWAAPSKDRWCVRARLWCARSYP